MSIQRSWTIRHISLVPLCVGLDKFHWIFKLFLKHRVMVRALASSAVDRGFEFRSGQTKDYKIGICCFSAK
jgi:hypothetical protein